jgi:N,N'-diacetyllegionaminate synthase
MSNYKEIDNAVKIFDKKKIILLQCSSIYPCPLDQVGINVIKEFSKKYKCHVGFSDHTLRIISFICSSYMGASYLLEKHFTLSRKMYGSDAKNSMEPDEFKLFSKTIKEIWHINKCDNVNKNNIKKFKNMKIDF